MKQDTTESIGKLRRQIAELEARLDGLREKLARKTQDGKTQDARGKTGLDLLWAAALPKARERSSRHRCRVEWNRIPVGERPTVRELIDALKAWNRCEAWRCDGNMFVPGLHRFLKERMWEDLPEDSRPLARHAAARPAKPAPPEPTEEDRQALEEFLRTPPGKLMRS